MEKTKAQLKVLRESLGLSQKNIAEIYDISVRTVVRWESPTEPQIATTEYWDFLNGIYAHVSRCAEDIVRTAKESSCNVLILDYTVNESAVSRLSNTINKVAAEKAKQEGCEFSFVYSNRSSDTTNNFIAGCRIGQIVKRAADEVEAPNDFINKFALDPRQCLPILINNCRGLGCEEELKIAKALLKNLPHSIEDEFQAGFYLGCSCLGS